MIRAHNTAPSIGELEYDIPLTASLPLHLDGDEETSNLPASATADLYIGGSYWPCASVSLHSLPHERQQEEAQRFSAYTLRGTAVANHVAENQRDISRRKRDTQPTWIVCVTRLSYDYCRARRITLFTLARLFHPSFFAPDTRPSSRPPSRNRSRRRDEIGSKENALSTSPQNSLLRRDALCTGPCALWICHLPFVEMDGFERQLCCRPCIYKFFYVEGIFVRRSAAVVVVVMVNWNLIVIFWKFGSITVTWSINFWTFLKFNAR